MGQKHILVKSTLKGNDAQKFEDIKKKYGVLHNSEVLRILINNSYQELQKPKEG